MESIKNLGCIIRKRNLLAHLSIWAIVAIVFTASQTVFAGSLIGIIYLMFFLTFILIFQTSYSFWARSVKCYCLILSVYSSLVCIFTYALQYMDLKEWLENYISQPTLQDIGLHVNQTAWDVFLEPFLALLIVILLVLYLKIFHDDFNRFTYLAEENDSSLSTPLTDSQSVTQQATINDATRITIFSKENNSRRVSNSITLQDNPNNHLAPKRLTRSQSQMSGSTSLISNHSAINASRSDLRRASKAISIKKFFDSILECIWRILETHFIKLVAFMLFRLPIVDVCLMNFPLVIIVIITLRHPSSARCCCWAASWLISAIVSVRSLTNLVAFRTSSFALAKQVCNNPDAPDPLKPPAEFSYLDYIGINHDINNPLNQISNHIWVLVLTTLYSFICIHYERRNIKDYELSFGVIFTGIGRREADFSVINTIKYFCNFGFYKFGIEITCLILIIAISNRLDVVAAVYGIILTILSITTSKRTLASVWPVLCLLISILIPVQYALRLGYPRALCMQYPWAWFNADIQHWLYLPNYTTNQEAKLLLYDFLVFLALCRQAVVFNQMSMNSSRSSMLTGRSNHHEFSANQFRLRYLPNTDEFITEDCFSNYTTQTNYVKSIFFISIYWITLAVVLAAGATNISLFSLGYLIGCFIFLWLGNDTYLMPLKRLIFNWNWFIFYATLVIFIKVILQLFTCYEHDYLLNHCYILKLLRVVCYRKRAASLPVPGPNPTPPDAAPINMTCLNSLPYDELDILWDGLCLMFLLMQRVVFGSQYFKFLVQEVKAQQILASRGAELIMATQIEEAKAQELYEKEVMRSVRQKMENLKSDDEAISKAWQRLLNLPHHHQIIRNADKHMFNHNLDEPVSQVRSDDWKFRKAFIPDPLGDELERMNEINGISAVITRWMKGQPLYGGLNSAQASGASSHTHIDEITSDQQADTGDEDQLHKVNREETDLPKDIDPLDKPLGESDDEGDDEEGGRMRGCWDMLNLIIYSCLLSATVQLNKLSRSYRYVSRRMADEKNVLKRKFNLNDERFKKDPAWRKWVISTLSENYRKTDEQHSSKQSNTSLHRIRSALKVMTSTNTSSQDSQHSSDSDRSPPNNNAQLGHQSSSPKPTNRSELSDQEYYFLKLNMFTQFCRALACVFISNTSLLCQLVIIFNQVLTASLLSLPLPLLTFLWGTLSVPRPTKRFWKTVITYTELVIVIKYVFQFPIWNWDGNNINPFYYPNLLGITNITILYDLTLLLALFLHRSMLKSLGQWDTTIQDCQIVEYQKLTDNWPKSDQDAQRAAGETFDDSGNQIRFVKSCQLEENDDRSIELATRATQSVDDPAQRHQNWHASYQNPVQEVELTTNGYGATPAIEPEVGTKTCCGCCKRAYTRAQRSIMLFFHHVLNTPFKVQTDVYVWMFLCDFINFLLLIYGFWAFGSGYTKQTVASFLNENRIPFSVLIMLLAQFASIIIDRAFYLQKNLTGKLLFQVVLVLAIHGWLFFALPFTTGHTLTLKEYWPPKAWYVFKCIYFLLSAHQIRCGYPRRVLGNCFTKGYGYANWGTFKVYRAIPLVYDLRLYMDWIWTETTLEFRNWSIMEDMYANLFIRKCELTLEEEYPMPKATPMRRISKYLTGGAFILLILAIIWGPLLLFSMGKTVGESNRPVEMLYELEFVGYQPILRMRATAQQIKPLDDPQYDALKSKFVSLSSQSFLGDYKIGDVVAIKLDGQSNAIWEISPPSKESLMKNVKDNVTLTLKSSWTLYRIKREKSQNFDVSISGSSQKIIDGNSTDEHEFRTNLYKILEQPADSSALTAMGKYVITPPIFPNFIRVPETGQVSLVDSFEDNLFQYKTLRPLNITYIRKLDNDSHEASSWWEAKDLCNPDHVFSFWTPQMLPHCDSLLVVAFNDRIFTGILALLSAPGIIGLYTTFVVFFARLIRTEPANKVIYSELPNVDRVYGLIMDIYMMRECGEFELEEKLFAKLLFLYRCPDMLIEWSSGSS